MSSVPLATSCASPRSHASAPAAPSRPHVPRLWPGATIVVVGSGPSLAVADLHACRAAGAKLLVINDGWRLIDADVLYAADYHWWKALAADGITDAQLPPLKFALEQFVTEVWPTVTPLRYAGKSGLSDDPTCIYSGGHSGYQAIGVAAHLVGPRSRIILLGCDMQTGRGGQHHFVGHPRATGNLKYHIWRPLYATLVAPLAARSIEILNCSRRTTLTAFPCVPLEQALRRQILL